MTERGAKRRAKAKAPGSLPAAKPKPRAKGAGGEAPAIAALSGQRLAEVVAARIEQDIVDRGWPVGETLGSETDLIERFGVSRAVFREAVRIVEHHNVARMRRGPGGGLVVAEPDPRAVQSAMALYLRYAGVSRSALFEARAALELAAVAAATERITEEGIERLRAVLATEDAGGEQATPEAHAHALHVVIGELTGNPAMALFIEVLNRLDEDLQPPGVQRQERLGDSVADHRTAHAAIVEAIASGDVSVAQHRMRRHLDAILRRLDD